MQAIDGDESGERWVKSRCRRRKLLPRNDFSVVRDRSTAVAVPPGKRNGWEHQDLRRRHLLVSEMKTSPHADHAVARPLEKHSALQATSSIVPLEPPATSITGRVCYDCDDWYARVDGGGSARSRLLSCLIRPLLLAPVE